MTGPLRGIASRASCLLPWHRMSSSSSRASRQQPTKQPRPPLPRRPKEPTVVHRPYKPRAAGHAPSPETRHATKTTPAFKTTRRPGTTPPSPPAQPDTLLTLWRRSWIPLTGAALVAGCLGFYLVGTAVASIDTCPCRDPNAAPTGRPPALTGDNAHQFDRDLDASEWWMGITGLRRKIAKCARGHVLEVAMGTGRNLKYYNWLPLCAVAEGRPAPGPAFPGIVSFTGLDISVDMLDVARKGLVRAVPPMASSAAIVKASTMSDHTGGQLSFLRHHLRLINSDAHRPLPPPPATMPTDTAAGLKYDTVIQTFGLCSVSDPVAVLASLASVVKPGTGRIILLEHGKGWYGVVNGLLDKYAGKHFAKYGCWWNRDVEALVEEAVRTTGGLEVVKLHRPNFWQLGTLVWVELRVAHKA